MMPLNLFPFMQDDGYGGFQGNQGNQGFGGFPAIEDRMPWNPNGPPAIPEPIPNAIPGPGGRPNPISSFDWDRMGDPGDIRQFLQDMASRLGTPGGIDPGRFSRILASISPVPGLGAAVGGATGADPLAAISNLRNRGTAQSRPTGGNFSESVMQLIPNGWRGYSGDRLNYFRTVAQVAMEEGHSIGGVTAAVAIAEAEAWRPGPQGVGDSGNSHGPFQFHRQGQLPDFARAMGVSVQEAERKLDSGEWTEQALHYSLRPEGYMGSSLRYQESQGRRGPELASAVAAQAQRPRADLVPKYGQVYNSMWSNTDLSQQTTTTTPPRGLTIPQFTAEQITDPAQAAALVSDLWNQLGGLMGDDPQLNQTMINQFTTFVGTLDKIQDRVAREGQDSIMNQFRDIEARQRQQQIDETSRNNAANVQLGYAGLRTTERGQDLANQLGNRQAANSEAQTEINRLVAMHQIAVGEHADKRAERTFLEVTLPQSAALIDQIYGNLEVARGQLGVSQGQLALAGQKEEREGNQWQRAFEANLAEQAANREFQTGIATGYLNGQPTAAERRAQEAETRANRNEAFQVQQHQDALRRDFIAQARALAADRREAAMAQVGLLQKMGGYLVSEGKQYIPGREPGSFRRVVETRNAPRLPLSAMDVYSPAANSMSLLQYHPGAPSGYQAPPAQSMQQLMGPMVDRDMNDPRNLPALMQLIAGLGY